MDLDKNFETSIDIIEKSESKENLESYNGKQISLISVSPNGTYVVTYSREDNSIEGWNVDGDSAIAPKWLSLERDPQVTVYKPDYRYKIGEIKVNDNKILLCATKYSLKKVIQMSDNNNPIELNDFPLHKHDQYYFKKNGDLVMNKWRTRELRQILVYSLQNNKLILISSYQFSCDYINNGGRIIGDDILWTTSSNYLFQWKLDPIQLKFSYSLGFDRIDEVKIRKDVIIVKCDKGVEIYSEGDFLRYIQLEYSTTKIELLCDQYLLVFREAKDEEGKQHIKLYDLTDNNKVFVDATKIFEDEESEINIFLYEYNAESKKAFGLVNGRISSMNLSNWNCHEFFKSNYVFDVDETIGWNAYLNEESNETLSNHGNDGDETLSNHGNDVDETLYDHMNVDDDDHETMADIENIEETFSTDYISSSGIIDKDFKNKNYKWKVNPDKHELLVCDIKNNDAKLDSKHLLKGHVIKWYLLNNNALVLLYDDYMTIYKYDINNKRIKIQYYYSNYRKELTAEEFSGSILPIYIDQDDNNSEIFDEWIKNLIEDNKYLAKCGQTLFPILIKKKLTSHIESIYGKCVRLAKEDPKRNLNFLKIITLSMEDLCEEYPDYITRFNSEMFMLLDPFHEIINDLRIYHHFAYSQEMDVHKKMFIFQYISMISMYSKNFLYHLISFFCDIDLVDLLDYRCCLKLFLFILFFPIPIILIIVSIIYRNYISHSATSHYIFLIVPYISFSCYSSKYDWWRDLFIPQSSVFVKTCKNKEFYTNWNGEAIINFKWKKFGKYYYFGGWLIFTVFLICFTMASYPSNSITQEIRIRLYLTSIAFGFFHMVFELRQIIWSPIRYVESIWNWFDLSAYLFATIASFHRIYYENTPYWVLSASCLLLDVKFLLFFRIFELFDIGIYFTLIFGVAKRICSFLVILAIIVISFAHALFVLLHPDNYIDSLSISNSNSSDSNNPWSLTNTYSQVDENGNINPNETLIQKPDQNTNLFYSYPTSLLAMYRFLTGDQSSLSSRTPTIENSPLLVLMAIFSLIVVIYLMNLFIGLLNMAINKENSRASYLAQKAEVLAEIELFYLLPFQRRWRTWFPEVIYYTVSYKKARIYVKKAIDDGDWKMDDCDFKILKCLNIEDAIENYCV